MLGLVKLATFEERVCFIIAKPGCRGPSWDWPDAVDDNFQFAVEDTVQTVRAAYIDAHARTGLRDACTSALSAAAAPDSHGAEVMQLPPARGSQRIPRPESNVRQSGGVITVLLRYDHHVDHTFLEATHYRDDEGVLSVYAGEEEIARFSAGSWDGVYRHEDTWVREKDGRERPAQRLEARLTAAE